MSAGTRSEFAAAAIPARLSGRRAVTAEPGTRRGRRSRSRGELAIGAAGGLGLVGVAFTVWLGLWVTPPAVSMGNLVRLIYVHPPVAWVCYLAFSVTALSSLGYLWRRTRAPGWDRLAGASAEVGVVFAGLTLASGSIWGKPTWGVWWTWDARLTSTAILAVLYIGYLALRRVPGDPGAVARRAAVAGVLAFVAVPVNYLSVYWWQTLHQTGTVLDPSKEMHIHGSMAWTLLLGFCAFTLVYVWMVGRRCQIFRLNERIEGEGLDAALAERVAEAPVGELVSR